MPSPFPGMNPYLEQPEIWLQVYKWLTILMAQTLNPQLRPNYRVAIEERVYETKGDDSLLVGIPDDLVVQSSLTTQTTDKTNSINTVVATPPVKPVKNTLPMTKTIKEWYLEVRQVETGAVITVIEILSPKNKRPGEDRIKYESKRQKILESLTHLIEIDLLRQGKSMPMDGQDIQSHYRIVVSRSSERPQADLYAFNLQQAIPAVPLPLQPQDTEPVINLQDLLHRLYDQGSYDLAINYRIEPTPLLLQADAAWVDNVLREQGLR